MSGPAMGGPAMLGSARLALREACTRARARGTKTHPVAPAVLTQVTGAHPGVRDALPGLVRTAAFALTYARGALGGRETWSAIGLRRGGAQQPLRASRPSILRRHRRFPSLGLGCRPIAPRTRRSPRLGRRRARRGRLVARGEHETAQEEPTNEGWSGVGERGREACTHDPNATTPTALHPPASLQRASPARRRAAVRPAAC